MATSSEFHGRSRSNTGAASVASAATTTTSDGLHSQAGGGPLDTVHHPVAQVDLTEIDGGLGMLLERSRQSLGSCKEAAVFLRSRARVEEEYGRGLQKVAQQTLKMMDNGGKSAVGMSTQQAAWQRLVEVHETLATNRMKFSITLSEMADYLANYVKIKEGVRRKLKESELRYQKAIDDSQAMLEKARAKYEVQCGEWERLLVKSGKADGAPGPASTPGLSAGAVSGPGAMLAGGATAGAAAKATKHVGSAMSGIFGKHKGTPQETLERLGQEAGVKAKVANEAYKRLLYQTNAIRRDFYDVQLPKTLASVMGLAEEVDQFLKFTLGKYAYTYESAVLADAITLKPMDGATVGMVEMVGDIDSKADLDTYLQAAAQSGGRVDRASIPYHEYRMSTLAQLYANPRPIFGVPLDEQLARDGQPVPLILLKCAEAVEAYGLQNEGIYRQSGQSSQVNKLRADLDLSAEHVSFAGSSTAGDVNNIASVLKMYLRELPGGLIPAPQCAAMLAHFSAEDAPMDDYMLDSKIHGVAAAIQSMPEPYRRTLAHLFTHLDKVQAFQEFNMMNSENLGIVFGPTILPPASNSPATAAMDIRRSAKMVKFILDNRRAIFEHI
ncbi:Rho GTPase-activating protein [Coemansia spiralis]|nr:Rho GTPase-activating protein [Coemansia spiralis]